MAASFNRTNWQLKGQVFGREMRAFNNARWSRFDITSQDHIGITGYGPNINIARDPRFGRTSELPGEDPFLNGHYASHMVQGMQHQDRNGHPAMVGGHTGVHWCLCVWSWKFAVVPFCMRLDVIWNDCKTLKNV
jgi:beta-D-xylosidase 4